MSFSRVYHEFFPGLSQVSANVPSMLFEHVDFVMSTRLYIFNFFLNKYSCNKHIIHNLVVCC